MTFTEKTKKELHSWLKKYPNVNGFSAELQDEFKEDKKTGRKAVRVYVTKKKKLEELAEEEKLPEEYEVEVTGKYPVDVVELGEVNALSSTFQDPKKRYRPVFGGISVGHYKITAGTLSCIVKDKSNGAVGILSNNHVLANENNAVAGDPELQPGPYDSGTVANDTIATLTRFVPVSFLGQPSNCPNAKWYSAIYNGLASLLKRKTRLVAISTEALTNEVDCAFAGLASGVNYLAVENGIAFTPKAYGTAQVNDTVTKSGRTTGVTTGTVIDTAGTINVGYGGSNVATFVNQIIIADGGTPFSQGGDSGSLILRPSDQTAVGLLFAGGSGSTIANHIDKVVTALSIDIVF